MTEMAGIEKPLTAVPVPEGYEPHAGDCLRIWHPDWALLPDVYGRWLTITSTEDTSLVLPPISAVTLVRDAALRCARYTLEDGRDTGCLSVIWIGAGTELDPETYARHLERTAAKAG